METMRWLPIVPLGLPHSLYQDDTYNGSSFQMVLWLLQYIFTRCVLYVLFLISILVEHLEYASQSRRLSETRGLQSGQIPHKRWQDKYFGPRSRYNHFWLRTAAGVDEFGEPVVLTAEGTTDGISTPLTFPRYIRPRSPQAETLIREIAEYEETEGTSRDF